MSSRTTTDPPMKRSAAVFLIGLLAFATVAFCGIGAMAWRQAVQDRAIEPVKVHGVVTDRFSGGGAGKSPRLAIYFDDRRLGFIEGDRRVGGGSRGVPSRLRPVQLGPAECVRPPASSRWRYSSG